MFRGTGVWGLGKYTPYRQLITASFPIPYSLLQNSTSRTRRGLV